MTQIERPTENDKEKKNVLLADNDHAVRAALQQALTAENYNVLPAGSSLEALRAVGDHRIDIALLDLDLGDNQSGWETFRHLAELEPLLPIVVMSAEPERLCLDSLTLRRPDATFEKPLLNLPFLFETLQRLTSSPKNN